MKQLNNKVIFLTGGTEGIGYECAKAYVHEGAHVIIAANCETKLSEVAEEFGPGHLGIFCDVSNAADVRNAINRSLEVYGRIDAIHNNAGIAHPSKTLDETTSEEWDQLMNVNLKSIFHTVKYGFAALKASEGCILNTSSLVGEIGQELHAAYTATKGGVNALTKSLALDYAKYNIRVNAVSPAGVLTPMLKKWKEEQPDPAHITAYLDAIHPLGYCPGGDVIADACVFLLSDKARFITGCILPVSGGAELGYRSIITVPDPLEIEK
ncbi:SDR family oxidoreductase [Chitinophagaceae bacterium LB-8]|uniref:SDR family oxidoreductase n=1 Tax=Paraflavisolibacter caeni TaxID=2982496 RepID=A0A9X2XUH4_9BACT|nr:SDR family NAD(P)-dependent oxidoreductase [Paraflavisolibacter caeni]MCU7548830.1 SDR family oxidoreductase [Paraflavisolibacter caeni]